MYRARIVGAATATLKHESMVSTRLLIAQPLGVDDSRDGSPLLVVDTMGAGHGDTVLITSDGRSARKYLADNTPVRWTTIGIEDQ